MQRNNYYINNKINFDKINKQKMNNKNYNIVMQSVKLINNFVMLVVKQKNNI